MRPVQRTSWPRLPSSPETSSCALCSAPRPSARKTSTVFSKTTVTGLTSLFLLASLTGCATATPQLIRSLPPQALLQDCPHPELDIQTNGDLLRGLRAYEQALSLCNIDKQALREWAKDQP